MNDNLLYKKQFETDFFTAKNGKPLSITFIKHASLMIDYDGFIVYVDPVAKQDDMTVDFSVFPPADLIVVTHEHYDHLDNDVVEMLSKETTDVLATKNSIAQLGFGDEVDPGDTVMINDDVFVEVVAAYNISPEQLQFHPKERGDAGYVIVLGGMRIYVAGDSEDTPEMCGVKNIDIAFLPVNQPYTMKVAQAADAAKAINPIVFYPYHYSATDVNQLKGMLSDTGIDVRIRAMQ